MSKVKPKKMVRRSVAIALGIICIILIIVIAYLTTNVSTQGHSNADYDALQNQVNELSDIYSP